MLAVGNTRSLDDPAPAAIPLSFPALLRNPGIASRYAYLSDSVSEKPKPIVPKKHKTLRRDDNEGKRWIRRKENARFSGNAHIVQPGKKDYQQPVPQIRTTFPEPLPVYLARNNKVPGAALPVTDPRSADCGRFSLGLKGMRRDLRKMGFRSKPLVVDIETELVGWLDAGGTLLSPDAPAGSLNSFSGTPVGTTGTVVEISRTPLQLVWRMTDDSDAFARYVVHCTARYHKIVSFSKEVSGQRLTYLLRPNVNYPEYHASIGVDTPPPTDVDLSSQLDTESEFASDHDTRSEAGDSVADSVVDHMSTIEEDVVSSSSAHPPPAPDFIEDDWSEVGDVDTDGNESGNESAMGQSIASLGGDPDATFTVERGLAQLSLRARTLNHVAQNRSTSSPSRSPVRSTRRIVPLAPSTREINPPKSFYDYLFS
ncbi:Pentatricopeptide repeat-containing protein [Mycena venus]|uniref:Pentatricopeptide repeat-containing protein n=1 Tax=Mycena venus TaxID=2733690 RepID=A0A8H6YNK4_9AGAR|nr:Pentatricopeptide repeat-containing protein [Mycena venus]